MGFISAHVHIMHAFMGMHCSFDFVNMAELSEHCFHCFVWGKKEFGFSEMSTVVDNLYEIYPPCSCQYVW
jgi:hypothetical protein